MFDDIATIRPQPRARMPGRNAWQRWNSESTFTDITRRHCSKVIRSKGMNGWIPAFSTRMSAPPSSSAAAAMPATEAASLMSAGTATAVPPSAAISSRVSAASARSAITTRAPRAARPTASARPIPFAAPVTTAVRPAWVRVTARPAQNRRRPASTSSGRSSSSYCRMPSA